MPVASGADKRVLTPQQRDCILRELNQILRHSSFCHSERSVKLLRYLVEAAVEGDAHPIKERTIGHEVFGRSVGYETSTDPIVRNSASEVRKRLAQYYLALDHAAEVRIGLVPGTYLPEFRFPEVQGAVAQQPPSPTVPADPATLQISGAGKQKRWNEKVIIVALCVVLVGLLSWQISSFWQRRSENAAVDRFWGPLFAAPGEPLVSVGLRNSTPGTAQASNLLPTLAVADASSYAAIEGLLDAHGRKFRMLTADQTQYSDLRQRPVILIGGFNNPWMLQLNAKLPYRLARQLVRSTTDGTSRQDSWVEDSAKPAKQWKSSPELRDSDGPVVEYALAGRVSDKAIGDITYFVGGAGSHATEAAAEFITQQKYLQRLPKGAFDPNMNVEVVLKIEVVHGVVGAPEIQTIGIW